MKKILALILTTLIGGAVLTMAIPVPVYAADCEGGTVLGFKAWYSGLTMGPECTIDPSNFQGDQNAVTVTVWKIILNLVFDVSLVIGLVAVMLILYGSFRYYLMAGGDPGKVMKAKKIITNAAIGLVIGILASVISNTIIMVIGGAAK